MSFKVLDISKHQGSFNAMTAKAKGIDAVILRLAYATSKDVLACNWAQDIKTNNMKLGGYGFGTWHYQSVCGGSIGTARQVMRSQVQRWIQVANEIGVNWYLAIDQELESTNSMGLTMDENTTLLNEAADMIKAAGYTPIIYCSIAWDYSRIRTSRLNSDLHYWFAWYVPACDAKDFDAVSVADIPSGTLGNWFRKCYQGGRLAGWQYDSTSFGHVYGAGSDNIDRSWFYLTDSAPTNGDDITPDPDVNDEVISDGLYTITITASKGDKDAVVQLCEDMQIPYKVSK